MKGRLTSLIRIATLLAANKARFIVACCLAVLVIVFLWGGYDELVQSLDDDDPLLFPTMIPVAKYLATGLSWTPTQSVALNILLGLFHVILLVFGVGVTFTLDFCLFYGPLLAGGIVGLIFALLTNFVIVLLKDIFRLGVNYVSFGASATTCAVIVLIGTHAFVACCLLYYCIIPIFWKLVFAPLLLLIGRRKVKGGRLTSQEETQKLQGLLKEIKNQIKEGKSMVKATKDTERALKRKEDKLVRLINTIRRDSPEVLEGLPDISNRPSELYYSGFLGELIKRLEFEQVHKTKKKETDLVKTAKVLAEEVAGWWEARTKVEEAKYNFEETNERLKARRRALGEGKIWDIERKKIDIELAQLDKTQAELEREGSEARSFSRKIEKEEEKEKDLAKEAERKIAQTIAVQMARMEGVFKRATFLAEQERQIRENYPPEVTERILDLVDRIMTEEDIG